MNFPQYAFNNVRRNRRAYLAYLLSSAFMVMIFFTYSVFIYHPQIENTPMGTMTQIGMTIATYIVYVFAFFFVLYSISMFLKSRNHEFGILTILGAESKQINTLILLENTIISAIAIISGILSGLLMSKIFLLISSIVIGMDSLPFYWPTKAIGLTVFAFTILFLVISFFTLMFINRSQVLDLLTGGRKPKQEPRANFLMVLLGKLLLATGFSTLHVGQLTPIRLSVAALTGIAGTYFFYSQLLVWGVRMIQKKPNFTWKGTSLLWISEMSYKLKDNARMLFLVTVVTSLACMSVGFVLAYQQALRVDFEANPFALTFKPLDDTSEEAVQSELSEIEKHLQAADLSYKRIHTEMIYSNIANSSEDYLMVMSQTGYSKFAITMNTDPAETLNKNAALLVQTPMAAKQNAFPSDTIDIQQLGSLRSLKYKTRTEQLATMNWNDIILVVNDDVYEELKKEKLSEGLNISRTTVYLLPDSEGVPDKNDPEMVVGNKLVDRQNKMFEVGNSIGFINSRAESYYSQNQAFSLFSFIGVFLALIFSISSASFLYFKLYIELAADQITYRSLSKIGLSSKEMNISATLQIAVLFFIPIFVAAIQSLVVLEPILAYMKIPYVSGPVLLASGAFLVLQWVYFLIARASYIKAVNKIMV
jgi:putative ABC transport system permease protein